MGLRVHGVTDQILVIDKVLKIPSNKVPTHDGAEGEKSRKRIVFGVH